MLITLGTIFICTAMAIIFRILAIDCLKREMHWIGGFLYNVGIIPTIIAAGVLILGCPFVMFKSEYDIKILYETLYIPKILREIKYRIGLIRKDEETDDDYY